jgi:hypothetical protein
MGFMTWVRVMCEKHPTQVVTVERRQHQSGYDRENEIAYDFTLFVKPCPLCQHEALHSAGG